MRKWRENGERMGKWRVNGEVMRNREIDFPHFLILSTFPHSLSISSLSHNFLHQNMSQFVAKCYIRECHKKHNIRAMRNQFWVEFAARKLRMLCWPARGYNPVFCNFSSFDNIIHFLQFFSCCRYNTVFRNFSLFFFDTRMQCPLSQNYHLFWKLTQVNDYHKEVRTVSVSGKENAAKKYTSWVGQCCVIWRAVSVIAVAPHSSPSFRQLFSSCSQKIQVQSL